MYVVFWFYLTRCKTLTENLSKKLKRIEFIRLFTGLSALVIGWEQLSWLALFGSWGKWVVVGLLVSIFLYFLHQHKKTRQTKKLLFLSGGLLSTGNISAQA